MGNCFKSSSNDDISLIRGNSEQPPDRNQPESNSAPVNSEPPPPYSFRTEAEPEWLPVYHPSPGQTRTVNQLTEEEQIKIAQRIGLISHLPSGRFDGSNKNAKECVICMNEFCLDEQLRYLPCMHIYHRDCIDDWLMRSFTCPSCLEPVDAALLLTFQAG